MPDQMIATIAAFGGGDSEPTWGAGEILSDRGRAFLSGLLEELQKLLGYHNINTMAYHPQTDGLVEKYNWTLIAMLAKVVERGGRDWDEHLPYILFLTGLASNSPPLSPPFTCCRAETLVFLLRLP